jgi:long-chain acyl-CoA synthetase
LPTITKHPVLRALARFSLTKKLLYRIIGRKILGAFGGRLEGAFIGGASLNHEIEVFMSAGGIPYVCGYGMSECAPVVTASSVEASKIGAVGHAVPEVSVKIAEPDPESGAGEILVTGPNVMVGYYKNEAATEQVFTSDGWLITGDRGYLDDDGFLYIVGRSKNVIIGPSGENIYPEVIEDKLKESVYIEEALVYELDKQLVARVYPDYSYINSQESNRDENVIAADIVDILEEVQQEVNTRLPTFSRIQKMIEQPAPFIKTPTKKIKRAEYVPGYLTSTSG